MRSKRMKQKVKRSKVKPDPRRVAYGNPDLSDTCRWRKTGQINQL